MRVDQLINAQVDQHRPHDEGGLEHLCPSLGLLTKTLAPSPVVRWMLPARIRHKNKDDIVFIGEDFIELKQIERDGSLTHIATKADFDCSILAAKVFGEYVEEDDEDMDPDYDIKVEDHRKGHTSYPGMTRLPPQCLVLTMANHQLVFMFACEDSQGTVNFDLSSTIPLPAFPDPVQQLGRHLAVDPKSRAIAVAGAQDNIYLYSAEPMGSESRWGLGFLPISSERPLKRIRGVIQQMDFLYPAEADPDHVILLLVVIKDNKTALITVDWLYSAGIQSAQTHNPLPIGKGAPIPNLLIPIESSAAFMLTLGCDMWLYTGILTGHVQPPVLVRFPDPQSESSQPQQKLAGASPCLPRWVSWARPRRTRGPHRMEDTLYLAREDGEICYLGLIRNSPESGAVGHHINRFDCHIDTAFTCYGNQDQNDFFAICGAMSEGSIHHVMPIPSSVSEMGTEITSILPNWTPMFDLIASKLSRNMDGTVRSRDALFTPSGKQPFGRLSELRFGIEARSTLVLHEAMLPSVTKLWTLPMEDNEELLVLLTSPIGSCLMSIPQNAFEEGEIAIIDGNTGLDTSRRTLAAEVVADNFVMQITEEGISVSRNGKTSLLSQSCSAGKRISAAAIDDEHGVAVTATRQDDQSFLSLIHISVDDKAPSIQCLGVPSYTENEIISAAIFKTPMGMIAVFGTSDSNLLFYGLDPENGPQFLVQHAATGNGDALNACDDIVVLLDSEQSSSAESHDLMLLCGLRDGNLCAVGLRANRGESLSVLSSQRFSLGLTSVKLGPDGNARAGRAAYATCGGGFFKIRWTGAGSSELVISDVWITEAQDRSLQQGAIAAFSVVPPNNSLRSELSPCLFLTSGSYGYVTKVAETKPKIVPRSLTVQGTPTRAIHSNVYGCFVTVATEISVHPSLSNRSSESRSLRPVIHFKSSGPKAWEQSIYLDPGLRVYSMVEWSLQDLTGKRYAYILLGTGPIDNTVSTRGDIWLLHPILREGIVKEVRARKVKTLESAVYALAPYGERGIVVCTSPWLYLFEYQPSESRLAEVSRHRITSPGVYVTTAPPLIHVSTLDDSLITLLYDTQQGQLKPIGMDYRGRKTAYHLSLDIPCPSRLDSPTQAYPNSQNNASLALNLVTTKDRRLVGQLGPSISARSRTISNTVTTLFSATLPRSIIRLKQANIRPPWKAKSVPGILEDNIVGTAVDGTITGIAILEPALANRLRWVQRLCERNKKISPNAPSHAIDRFTGAFEDEGEAILLPPLGFEGGSVDGRINRPEAMHVNGDILKRMLDRGGAALLRHMLQEEALRKDKIGDFVRENLDSQLRMADTLAREIKSVLDRWW